MSGGQDEHAKIFNAKTFIAKIWGPRVVPGRDQSSDRGAYWQNSSATCLPGGASEASSTLGSVISTSGRSDARPAAASRYEASICCMDDSK